MFHTRGAQITIEVQSKRHNLCLFVHDWIWNQKPSNSHKPVKVAAKVTQKKEDTFEKQTNQQLMEKHMLNLALEEIEGRPPWSYASGYRHLGSPGLQQPSSTIGGAQYSMVQYNDNIAKYEMVLMSNTVRKEVMKVEQEYINWLANLQNKIRQWGETLIIYSVHHRQGVIFRAFSKLLGQSLARLVGAD